MEDRPTTIARRCFVAGRVQGVFYRASTREKAFELGCRGYARNLADGRVDVLIVGEPAAVHALIDWLWQGPPAAHVTAVDVHEIAPDDLGKLADEFVTGRD
jgi:acylphosphatase